MFTSGFEVAAAITTGVTLLCVIWWVFEPVPIPATSLLPLALFPLTGVLSRDQVAGAYGHPLVLLLLGGFILSTALAHNGAHRRVALNMVKLFGGGSSRRLVFGFMAASALLSMWISNTATALMLLPVALAVLERSRDKRLATPLLLGVAYAASVGGIGTPIGTPPNVVFMGVYSSMVGEEISFVRWMGWALPVVAVLLPIIGFWLTRGLDHSEPTELPDVGPWRTAEVRVMIVFAITAFAWVTRSAPWGGWTEWLGFPYSNDSIVAFLAAAVLFIVPNGTGGRLLTWEAAEKIPWGMLILFGGGIAIAGAFVESGLSAHIGQALEGMATLHPLLLTLGICLVVTFMTEATSNTATTTLLMPILAAGAFAASLDPRLLMIPAAMSASCAFMLPVATAPNLIMFSTGRFTIKTMAREGMVLNFVGAAVIGTMTYLFLA